MHLYQPCRSTATHCTYSQAELGSRPVAVLLSHLTTTNKSKKEVEEERELERKSQLVVERRDEKTERGTLQSNKRL